MSWKQPTPVDINSNQNLGFLERAIFREILSLCQNSTYLNRFVHANKHYAVKLERGQCILKIKNIADDLKIDKKRVRRCVDFISEWYTQLDSKAMPFGLIVTVKDYDRLVEMDSQKDNDGIMTGFSKDNERTPNKILKSEESEKIDESISLSGLTPDASHTPNQEKEPEKKPKGSKAQMDVEINLNKPHFNLTEERADKEIKQYYLPVYNASMLEIYNTKSNISSTGDLRKYWMHHRKDFSINQIVSAVKAFYSQNWVRDTRKRNRKWVGPDLLLRKEDSKGRAVNRIQEILNDIEYKKNLEEQQKSQPVKPNVQQQRPVLTPEEAQAHKVERERFLGRFGKPHPSTSTEERFAGLRKMVDEGVITMQQYEERVKAALSSQ